MTQQPRPICRVCSNRYVAINYYNKTTGITHWKNRCVRCVKDAYHPYRKQKDTICARCGFQQEHACQMDVDHIDGNHKNNDSANLQTLCANCHRLKTLDERLPNITISSHKSIFCINTDKEKHNGQ
jgi:ribosomal protein L37E